MMININRLRDIDLNHPSSWPPAFTIVIAFVIGATFLYTGWYFVLKPQLDTLGTYQDYEQQLRDAFLEVSSTVGQLPAYKKQIMELDQQWKSVSAQLPDEAKIDALLEEISELGQSHGLEFIKFDPQEERDQVFLVVTPIYIELRGSFHELAQFLGDLARIGRIVTVSDLVITADINNSSDVYRVAPLNATATILVYRYLSREQK